MKQCLRIIICITLLGIGYLIGYASAPKQENIINAIIESEALNDWELMELAIIKTESTFDSLAVGKGGDWGIIQITPIYVEEVNRILGEERYIHEDAFNPVKSLEMFDIMQAHHNPLMDIDKAIAGHNPTASAAYSVRVRRNIEWIKTYERYRKLVKRG